MVKTSGDAAGQSKSNRGRRPGDSTTRAAILDAGRRQFADRGYDRTTVRGIAAEAGVDAKLVSHWFATKQALFLAAVEMPVRPAEIWREALTTGNPDTLGERAAALILARWEDPLVRQRLVAFVRAAISEPAVTDLFRQIIMRDTMIPVAELIGGAQPRLRAELMASQVVGLMLARYVIRVEPLAALPADEVVRLLGPVLQHYLTVPLDCDGS